MEKKILSLPTNDKKIYAQVLMFLNFMLNLSDQERGVLAQIIKLNNEYESLSPDKRAKFILSTDMRKEMCDELDISIAHFAVVLSSIKKKKFLGIHQILDDNNVIHPYLMFKPDEEGFRIEVDFNKVEESLEQETTQEVNESISNKPEENVIPEKKELPPTKAGAENSILKEKNIILQLQKYDEKHKSTRRNTF